MTINLINIESLSNGLGIPFSTHEEYYIFSIEKENEVNFDVTVLKNGQYFFVSLILAENRYPIEHIEFYNDETEVEVLDELTSLLKKLKGSPCRVSDYKSWFEKKKKVELLEDGEWIMFGYPGSKKDRKPRHNQT